MNALEKLAGRLADRGLGNVARRVLAGAAVGGPAGAGAAVLSEVAGALGAKTNDPDELANAIAYADEADLVALRKLDNERIIGLAMQDTAREEIAADDRADARQYRSLDGQRNKLAKLLVFVMLAFIMALVAVAKYLPEAEMLMGALISGFSLAIAKFGGLYDYYFGSSSGSQTKEQGLFRSKAMTR